LFGITVGSLHVEIDHSYKQSGQPLEVFALAALALTDAKINNRPRHGYKHVACSCPGNLEGQTVSPRC